MPYPLKQLSRSEYTAPEEGHVLDALKAYCFEPEDTGICDFVPTHVLYQTYLDFMDAGGFAEILNAQQFGVALRRVFDIAPERKTRRTYQGWNTWGYYHVRGPGSIVTRAGRGNPNLYARPKTAAPVQAPGPDAPSFEARRAAARAAAAEED
jgi:hypothetical protein